MDQNGSPPRMTFPSFRFVQRASVMLRATYKEESKKRRKHFFPSHVSTYLWLGSTILFPSIEVSIFTKQMLRWSSPCTIINSFGKYVCGITRKRNLVVTSTSCTSFQIFSWRDKKDMLGPCIFLGIRTFFCKIRAESSNFQRWQWHTLMDSLDR